MLTTGRLSHTDLVHDLTGYASAKPHSYWDLAVFAKGETELFRSVVAAETSRRARGTRC
jgi:hypothetical protein